MANIGDVARVAGVSRATVSYLLSGKKRLTPETTQRIEAAIAELGFSVNSGARALATARTMTLGIVVQFHQAEFEPALATYLVAITDAAREAGYSVLLLTDADGPVAVRRAVSSRQVDGLVLLNVLEDDPRFAALTDSPVPAVLIGMPSDTRGIDAVDLDFETSATVLVDHLHEHGHTVVRFVTWPSAIYDAGHTFALRFRRAAHARAAELGVVLLDSPCRDEPGLIREDLTRHLRQADEATALLVHNDGAVAMLPSVLHDTGLRVPQDLSVVSLHSAQLASFFALPFTAVESQARTAADLAVNVLMDRLRGTGPDGVRHVQLPPVLVDQGSVATR